MKVPSYKKYWIGNVDIIWNQNNIQFQDEEHELALPKDIERARFTDIDLDLSEVDENRLEIDEEIKTSLGILEDQLRDEEITLKVRR